MAFDGYQNTFANSFFPTYQRQETLSVFIKLQSGKEEQASVNVGGGNSGGVALPFSIPNVLLQEQDSASYLPWPHSAHDDPYGLNNCAQASTKSRKPAENTDCDAETDLQGLVSNILDEAESQESYYSEGSIPTCNPVWSPKTLREELLQYFQSEAKTQQKPTFPQNFVSCETISKAQGQAANKDVGDYCQQSVGLATSQQQLFDLRNGDRDSCAFRPQKLPPGLPLPNIGNAYVSQKQQSKFDNPLADKDRGNTQPLNNFPDLSDVFRPQSEMINLCFDPYYEDHLSSSKAISNEQCMPQDITQLVSNFKSLMDGEHGNVYHGEFPNMHRPTVGMQHEDSTVEEWKMTGSSLSTQSTPAMQVQKQLAGEFGPVQMERNGEVWNQTFKCDALQGLPGFRPQNTPNKFSQQPKPFTESFNFPNQYQNKMTMYRENTSPPVNVSMNQYSKHHVQQGQIQSRIKPQMQREKKRMHMSGFSTRPLTNSNMRGGDKRQALSSNPYFDNFGSMQSQKFDRENSMVSAGNTQQLMALMYPVNDPRRHSGVPISSYNFHSRSTQPYDNVFPGMDMSDIMSANESAAFNSYVSNMMTRREESTYHGMASAMTTSMLMNQGGPVVQLYFYLDECYEQWRCLDKERKKTEMIIAKTFVGKRIPSVATANLPKTPLNPTRVDHLIVNQLREQARVASLLDRIERLQNVSLHINIHTALNRHHMALCITKERRKEEIANMSKHDKAHFTEARDTLLLAIALRDLAATTRRLRTALWCALQMTLPKPVKRHDHHVNKDAAGAERCPSPFEGYSFML